MDAPAPDLAPAVAEAKDAPRDAVRSGVLAAALVLGVVALSGLPDDPVPNLPSIVIALVGGALLALGGLRLRTTAGPGWLSHRSMTGRTWVRTDQLAEVRSGRGVGLVSLTLRDRDGRRVFVTSSTLATNPALAARVREDVRRSVAHGAQLDARAAEVLQVPVRKGGRS